MNPSIRVRRGAERRGEGRGRRGGEERGGRGHKAVRETSFPCENVSRVLCLSVLMYFCSRSLTYNERHRPPDKNKHIRVGAKGGGAAITAVEFRDEPFRDFLYNCTRRSIRNV